MSREHEFFEAATGAEWDWARGCFEAAGTLLVIVASDGQVQDINPFGAAILGRPAAEIVGQPWLCFFPARQQATVAAGHAACIEGHAAADARSEAWLLRPDGEERLIACRTTAMRDDHGRIVATVSAGEDITERRRWETDIRASEERLRLALASSLIVVFNQDGDLRYTWVHHPALGLPIEDGPGTAAVDLRPLESLKQDMLAAESVAPRARHPISGLGHRARNMLATVQAIARQGLRRGREPAPRDTAFKERIRTLGNAHTLLTVGDGRRASLRRLLEAELGPHARRTELAGPDVTLTPQATLTLALVLHELATNAVMHGAFATPDGRLAVTWGIERSTAEPIEFRLLWRESKVTPVPEPLHRGFGRAIIERGLEKELGGAATMRFLPDGLICELILPVATVLGAQILELPVRQRPRPAT